MKKIKMNELNKQISKSDQAKIEEILAKRQNHPNSNKQYDVLKGTAEVKYRNLIAHSDATEVFKKAHADFLAKKSVTNAKALLKAASDEQGAASKSGATILRKDRVEGARQQAMDTLDKEIGKSWRFSSDVNKALGVKDEVYIVKSEELDPRKVKFPPYCKKGRKETMSDGSTYNIFDME